ncbi:HEAT repeat domain-containing protein [Methanocrinis sp.]|uniref:HEAT repeat domain-containing protein n=1 Tax=Methanocrinis sp. TaxID=3101522 RepID=UPI003D0F6683
MQKVRSAGWGFDQVAEFLVGRIGFDDALAGPESFREKLRTVLERGPNQLRWRAARVLGEMRDPDSVPFLASALADESPVVRWEAAAALGKIGGPGVVEALLAALDDESRQVQKRAARALIVQLGVPGPDPENLAYLMKLLPSGNDEVAESLLKMAPAAERNLMELLDDDSFFVRRDSARLLARIFRAEMGAFPGGEVRSWDPAKIASLYRFRTRVDGEGLVKRVDYTGFDEISGIILGERKIVFSRLFDSETSVREGLDSRPIGLSDLLESKVDRLERVGRTLILSQEGRSLAIKLALGPGDEEKLLIEAAMQRQLGHLREDLGLESLIPRPIVPEGGGYLFRLRLSGLPGGVRGILGLQTDPWAICYSPPRGYFTYLNDFHLSSDSVSKGLIRCAHDLAVLARNGLVHDALIPLFHNREQTERRGDRGVYRWWSEIPGRLDRWLKSCQHPNLRLSGIADYEHFCQFAEIAPQKLHHLIGDQLLSISLVLASRYRILGEFDDDVVSEALRSIFETYILASVSEKSNSSSFYGSRSLLDGCIDWDRLASRMREEMGGERYTTGLVRGAGPEGSDLEIENGPHLGLFGGYFPLPELLRAIHLATAFAILGISQDEADWTGITP